MGWMKNFKLVIEYDGSAFSGWQRQKDRPTIQAEIENALQTMLRAPVKLIGSGRTDAGVHALGQVAHFHCETPRTATEIFKALNSLLPDAIVIRSCTQVAPEFHARFDAVRKTYHYRILNRPLPAAIGRQYVWHLRRDLNRSAMQAAAARLVGRHDFRSFEGTGSPRSSTVRTVFRCEWQVEGPDRLTLHLCADGFLRYMVRNIVGTLVEVGSGRITPEAFESILAAKDRTRAAATAPARGLFLVSVQYPPHVS
jgi:tRNA pseudouridine38-40 synthase